MGDQDHRVVGRGGGSAIAEIVVADNDVRAVVHMDRERAEIFDGAPIGRVLPGRFEEITRSTEHVAFDEDVLVLVGDALLHPLITIEVDTGARVVRKEAVANGEVVHVRSFHPRGFRSGGNRLGFAVVKHATVNQAILHFQIQRPGTEALELTKTKFR